MNNDIDINIGLAVDPSQANRELAKIAKESQNAINQYLNTALPPTIKNIGAVAMRLTVLGTAAYGTFKAITALEEAFIKLKDWYTASTYSTNIMIKAEQQRLDIVKLQLGYMEKMYSLQNNLKSGLIDAEKIANNLEREKQKELEQNRNRREENVLLIEEIAKNREMANRHNTDMALAKLQGGSKTADERAGVDRKNARIILEMPDGNRREIRVAREMNWDNTWSDRGKITVGNVGGVGKQEVIGEFLNRDHLEKLLNTFVDGIAVEQQKETAKRKSIAKTIGIDTDAQTEKSWDKKIMERDIAEIMRLQNNVIRQAAIDSISGVDATGYAIEMTHIEETHKARLRYLEEYERLRKEAWKEGNRGEIDILDKARLEAQQQSELQMAEARKKSHQTIAAAYDEIGRLMTTGNNGGRNAIAEWEENLNNVLRIEKEYREEVKKATTAEQMRTAEMKRQTLLVNERLRTENASRLATERDNLARMQQSAQRNLSETGITTAGNIAAEDMQAISDFRIKIFEGMRSGTMTAADFEMANIDRVYKMRQSREQALHEQRMQGLRDYEAQQEQSINTAYEEATSEARQRLALALKRLSEQNITDGQRRDAEHTVESNEAIIRKAEQERMKAMESLRTDARGSVRLDADFKQRMALEAARHREQISYLSAIEQNTGQYVADMSTTYKQLNSEMWAKSAPAMFGMPSTPFNNYASKQNIPQPVVFTDDKIIGALQLIVRNTNGMRNFDGRPRYG